MGDDVAYLIEQRWIPYGIYTPDFFDGHASFQFQFEVDFQYGLGSNTTVQNQGGAINGDQVNLQTKNANAAFYPTGVPQQLAIVVGLQSLYDTPHNPALTPLNTVVQSGYKLAFFASDAAGIAIYGNLGGRWKAAVSPLIAGQPNLAEQDPRFRYAVLSTLDYSFELAPRTELGFSSWYLRDSTSGTGSVFGALVSNGPSNSASLAPFTGVTTLPVERANANIFWLGTNFQHNLGFAKGALAASGFAMANLGTVSGDFVGDNLFNEVSVEGLAANLELQYNWGKTPGDRLTLESMFSTGDADRTDDRYTSAFTMNYYGLPGAIWFNHKMLILFPFTTTVSNYTGGITDISNQGLGLISAIGTASWDLIPYQLNAKLGVGWARAAHRPSLVDGFPRPGFDQGVEINMELEYTWRAFLTLGAHAGYLFTGDFYDNTRAVNNDAWAGFLTLTWVGF